MYELEGSGFVLPLSGQMMDELCESFRCSRDEIQNVVRPGDVEMSDNVADVEVSRDGDFYGEAGIWYIRCQESDEVYYQVIDEMPNIVPSCPYPEDFFCEDVSTEVFQ